MSALVLPLLLTLCGLAAATTAPAALVFSNCTTTTTGCSTTTLPPFCPNRDSTQDEALYLCAINHFNIFRQEVTSTARGSKFSSQCAVSLESGIGDTIVHIREHLEEGTDPSTDYCQALVVFNRECPTKRIGLESLNQLMLLLQTGCGPRLIYSSAAAAVNLGGAVVAGAVVAVVIFVGLITH